MSTYIFGPESMEKLVTCDQRLILFVLNALYDPRCPMDIKVLEGRRSEAQQRENVAKGVSWTMSSLHLYKPSRAVDLAPYPIDWQDIARFNELARYLKTIISELGLRIRWGGDFRTKYDGPHWELY